MIGERDRSLRLRLLTPFVRVGEKIVVVVEASNAPETTLNLKAPDTVLISQPHLQVVGSGSFEEKVTSTVEHVQKPVTVEISTEPIPQTVVCRILVD